MRAKPPHRRVFMQQRHLPVWVHPGSRQQTHAELATLAAELRVSIHDEPAAEVQDQPMVEQVRGRDAVRSVFADLVFAAATA